MEKQLDDIERGIDDVQASKGEQFTVKQLMKTRKAIKTKLEKLNDTKRKDTVIDFEQLGVDRLFIDESHFYAAVRRSWLLAVCTPFTRL